MGAIAGGRVDPGGADAPGGPRIDESEKPKASLLEYLRAGYKSEKAEGARHGKAPSPTLMGRTVVEQDDHFHVTDSRGSFKVAKAGLDEGTHAKIRGMCAGGEVKSFAGGGMVDAAHPENMSPEMKKALLDLQRQAQAPTPEMLAAGVAPHEPSPNDIVPGTTLTYAQAVDANAEASTGMQPPKLKPDDPQATLGGGALDRLQGPPKPAPKSLTTLRPAGVSPPPPQGAPQPQGGGGGSIPGLDPRDLAEARAGEAEGFQAKQAALAQEQAATSAAAQQQADLLKQKGVREAELAQQQVQMAADHKKALAEQMTAYQRAVDEYGRAGIDPDRYWANASTGQKVLAGIGLLFGALGAGHDGVNKSVSIINQAIDRDIDAQKEGLAVKGRSVEMRKGILSAVFAQLQDEDQALQATGDAYRKQAATMAEEMSVRTQDPIRQAQLKALAAGLIQSRAQERLAMEAGWQAKAAEIAVAKQKVAQGWAAIAAKGAGKGGGRPITATQQERLAGAKNAFQALQTIEQELQKIGPGVSPSALVPGTRAYRFSDKSKAAATVIGKFIENTRFSDADRKFYESLMPGMSDSAARQQEKVQQFKTLLQNKYGAEIQTMTQGGFNTSGFASGAPAVDAGAPAPDEDEE